MVANTTQISFQEILSFTPEGEEPKQMGSAFFRGANCNFNPYLKDHTRERFLENFLLKGLLPREPQIFRDTKVTAFGSCFAENITRYLSGLGFSLSKQRNPDIYISSMGEGLVNVHALAQQFEWALENVAPPENLWHGYRAEEFGYDEEVRAKTAEAFRTTEFFIITLGLSEIWYDEHTGGVFWRAVPLEHYDPARHKFRVCSFAESKALIERIHSIVRRHVPRAKLLFTLSPIPLAATFRPIGCIAANSASKAILRAALDEFLRDHADELNETLFYFPSYEIITDLFFRRHEPDGRHVRPPILHFVMQLFEAAYCDTGLPMHSLNAVYQRTRMENAASAADFASSPA
ncbi:MAG: GSCFA domain-containing protein [Propylenella sp.]